MKRANIKQYNQEYQDYILIESLSELWDFFEEKTHGMMKEGAVELVNRAKSRAAGKTITEIANVITLGTEKLNERRPKGILYRQAELMGDYQTTLEKHIMKGDKIAIYPGNMVSWFTLGEDAEYEIVSEREIYTKEDIRLIRWPNGTHWYAKISKIDVVIDGEQKWNDKHVAQAKAEQYLKNLQ